MSVLWTVIMMYFAVYSVFFVIIFQWLQIRSRRKARRRKDVDDKKEMIQ